MNECTRYEQLISCLIDGEISEAEKAELMEHIALCPSCAALYGAYSELFGHMDETAPEPPAQLLSGVMEKISNHEGPLPVPGQVKTKKRPAQRGAWVKYAAAAACLAIILLTVPTLLSKAGKDAPDAPAAADTADTAEDTAAPESAETDNNMNITQDSTSADTPVDDALPMEPTDEPAAGADTGAPAEDVQNHCTIYVTGALPASLDGFAQADNGDGTYTMAVSEDVARELIDFGYTAEYSDPSQDAATDYTVIFTPSV